MPRASLVLRLVSTSIGLVCLLPAACAPPAESPSEETPPDGLEYVPPRPGTYELPPIQEAADGSVIDADGSARRLFDYMGDKYVLLSFVYTRCSNPIGCPLATRTLDEVERGLEAEPDLAERVRLVTLSFDPERDSAEQMLRYAAREYVDTRWDARGWSFLTTESWDELQPILDGYGQYIVPEIDESGEPTGDFSHVLKVFLIDRERRVRNIYSSGYLHAALAINDVKTLIMMSEVESS